MYVPMMKWRSEYSHPLTLTNNRSEITSIGGKGIGLKREKQGNSVVDDLKMYNDKKENSIEEEFK